MARNAKGLNDARKALANDCSAPSARSDGRRAAKTNNKKRTKTFWVIFVGISSRASESLRFHPADSPGMYAKDEHAHAAKAKKPHSRGSPTGRRLFRRLVIGVHGRAGADKMAIAIGVVDAVDRWPVFVDGESARRDSRPVRGNMAGPTRRSGPGPCAGRS